MSNYKFEISLVNGDRLLVSSDENIRRAALPFLDVKAISRNGEAVQGLPGITIAWAHVVTYQLIEHSISNIVHDDD